MRHALCPAIDTEGRITVASKAVAIIFVLGIPTIATAYAVADGCLHGFSRTNLLIFLGMYVANGIGVTAGYHRLFTHRAFTTYQPIRYLLAILGCMAAEGAPILWASQHRAHHASSDTQGDPHSPWLNRKPGFIGAFKALLFAHYGHVFFQKEAIDVERFAPDLARERFLVWLERYGALVVAAGLLLPAAIGYWITSTWSGAFGGLLWGGFVRLFVLTHATGMVNSICHVFGSKPFDTGDESRNNFWLAPITLGESWHCNHHRFPTSARHGLRWWQIDVSWYVIRIMEILGLASGVIRVPLDRWKEKT